MTCERTSQSADGLIDRVPSRPLDERDVEAWPGGVSLDLDPAPSTSLQAGDVVWTLNTLSHFEDEACPYWVSRLVPGHPFLRMAFYANEAAHTRLGRPYTAEESLENFERSDTAFKHTLQDILENVLIQSQEGRRCIRINTSLPKTLAGVFSAVPENTYGCIRTTGVSVSHEGQVHNMVLATVESEIDLDELRSGVIAKFTPIHSFLFGASGRMLFANTKAQTWLQAHGLANLPYFDLASLLCQDGEPQPKLAEEAIKAIISHKEPHHRITLSNTCPDGSVRHTLYEMWPARDPVDSMTPAIIVSAFNVSHLAETELELEGMKAALQQHNADLQEQVQQISHGKAGVELERAALQTQLKAALQSHMLPRTSCTSILPLSPLDKIITVLDMLLEGGQPSKQQILDLRALLLQNNDLRQPTNLQEQFNTSNGMSEDANKSLMVMLQNTTHAVRRMARKQMGASVTAAHKLWHVEPASSSASGDHTPDRPTGQGHMVFPNAMSLSKPITLLVDALLAEAPNSWTFNMMELDEATDHHALSCYGYFLWQQSGLSDHFQMEEDNWVAFLHKLESGYRKNPYHNHVHAACVLHMADLLARQPEGLQSMGIVDELLLASLYLAAMFHDFGHPAVTNDFLQRTMDPLAILYNDQAPLEMHHAAASFKMLFEKTVIKSESTPMDDRQLARGTIIDLVIGTDMKQHFSHMSRLQAALQCEVYAQTSTSEGAGDQTEQQPRFANMTAEHRLVVMQAVMKSTDLGHWALPNHLHIEWVNRLQAEFFAQGDREREAGLTVSPLMDREKASSLSSSQVGFFEVIVMPLLRAMTAVLPAAQVMLDAATKNYYYWRMQNSDDGPSNGTSD